jgi:3-hydroxybenzoate/4-hydroxybenzoate---CoA ligase
MNVMATVSQPCHTNNASEQILGWQLAAGLGGTPAVLAGSRTITFAQLGAAVNRMGNALRADGVKQGDRILLLMKDSPEYVAAYLGALRIGAVAVALNTRASAREVGHAITDSECKAFVLDRDFEALYESSCTVAGFKPPRLIDDVAAFSSGHGDRLDAAPVLPGDTAFWIYTSGTTGLPKAAVHCHGDVAIGELHLAANFGVKPGDRVFSTSKLFFAFALGHSLIGALKCGASIILNDAWPDAEGVAAAVERHRPDIFLSVPTLYRNLLRSGVAARPAFLRVRHFVSAGERLPDRVFTEWLEQTGQPILEGIGTSETVFLAIANTPTAYSKGSAGRPQPWAKVKLVAEDGTVVQHPDETGVLWVKMASVAAGYWNRPDKTAESFADGWYCTGDVFSVDALGWWYHHGRADDMLKISGQWVSPTEIEEHALKLPGIAEVAAVGVANDDGLIRLGLAVVSTEQAPGRQALEERLRQHFERHLSIYKCPRRIRFVDELPRTATGKLQRFRVRSLFA